MGSQVSWSKPDNALIKGLKVPNWAIFNHHARAALNTHVCITTSILINI